MTRAAVGAALALVAASAIAIVWWRAHRVDAGGRTAPSTVLPTRDRASDARAREIVEQIDRILVRFDDVVLTSATPANDLVHALYAHGADYVILHEDRPISCVEWLVKQATVRDAADGRPIVDAGLSGWRFRRGTPQGESNTAEAHFAQFLFYLGVAGVDPNTTIVSLPDGAAVPLSDFVESLQAGIGEGIDLSYAMPALAMLSDEDSWVTRFGDRWTLDRLIRVHLDQEGTSDFCGGAHWSLALAIAATSQSSPTTGQSTSDRATRRLGELVADALEHVDAAGWFEVPFPDPTLPIRFSYLAHVIEWIVFGIEERRLLDVPALSRAIDRLTRELRERWDLYPFRDVCHGVRTSREVRRRPLAALSGG